MSSPSADVELYQRAKELSKSAESVIDCRRVLKLITQAYDINPLEKYKRRIDQLKVMITNAVENNSSSSESSSDDSRTGDDTHNTSQQSPPSSDRVKVPVSPRFENEANHLADAIAAVAISGDSTSERFVELQGIKVKRQIYDRLYSYQVDGLNWLLSLYHEDRQFKGGALADDMGLGKTIQSIVFISSLMENKKIRTALVVAPGTLLSNWAKEFKTWYPEIDLFSYHDATPKQRLLQLAACQRGGGVLFTTYGLLNNHVDEHLSQFRGSKFTWDVCVLDEAHTIKNPNKTSAAANRIPAKFRLAVSGTPLQNRLSELWAIYNWIFQGTLLGGYQNFKVTYELPITNARGKNASAASKERGTRLAESLRKVYMPYFLRRTKDEVLSVAGKISKKLPPKTDLIVWITLSDNQVAVYKDILKSKETKNAFREKQRALVMLQNLKKLCDSLLLLPASTVERLNRRKHKSNQENDANVLEELFTDDQVMVDVQSLDSKFILENTCKLKFLINLLALHREEGHRTLVFSRSVRMLDIIQHVLTLEGHKMARIDGSVKTRDRDVIIESFRQKTNIGVFLLTTGVGGVGLTLTEADRVVIYDPSWNPATDAQAIDRAYRIGQTKPVTVYRLITVSTVEEKIFRRQVFKNSVIKQMVNSERDPMRYFTDNDIRELFKFGDPNHCETFLHLLQVHGDHIANMEPEDLQKLLALDSIYNATDHNLLFSESDRNELEASGDSEKIDQVVASAEHNLQTDARAHRRSGHPSNWDPQDIAMIPTRKANKPVKAFPRLANPTDTEGIEVVEINDSNPFKSVSSDSNNSVEFIDRMPSTSPAREVEKIHLDDQEDEDEDQVKIDEISMLAPTNSTHLIGLTRPNKFETTISSIELSDGENDHHQSGNNSENSSREIDKTVQLTGKKERSRKEIKDSSNDSVDLAGSPLEPSKHTSAIRSKNLSLGEDSPVHVSVNSPGREDASDSQTDRSRDNGSEDADHSNDLSASDTEASSANNQTKFFDVTTIFEDGESVPTEDGAKLNSSSLSDKLQPERHVSEMHSCYDGKFSEPIQSPSFDPSANFTINGEQNTLFNLLQDTDESDSSSAATVETETHDLSSESSLT